jgi:SPASM domain peptide maturase of grasp-with-spasm system
LLSKYKNYSIDEIKQNFDEENIEIIDSYFKFLIDKEFGFWCDKHELEKFPEMNIHWESPRKIENLIIDIDQHSNHNFEKISIELEALGCKVIEFRFFNEVSLQEINSILEYFKKSRVRIFYLVIPFHTEFSKKNLENLCFSHQRINHIVISSSKVNKIYEMNNLFSHVEFIKDKIDSNLCCGKIDPKYFRVNIELFTESNIFNSCLNKKMGIDVNGEVKNCPSMQKSYGNVNIDNLYDIVNFNTEYSSLWNITKDQISICKDCEFRYICTDCRVFIKNEKDILSKPLKCKYNPYTTKWEK